MTRLDDLQPEQLPFTVGRYELQTVLGQGAMGRVFKAELAGPSGFRKPVAIKVLHARMDDLEGRQRLVREARIGALLRGPNLVDTYDLEELDGALMLVMEFIDGTTLKELLQKAQLRPDAVVELGRQLAAGLATAHDLVVNGEPAGLVHRDLKPANVLLDRSGNALISDFGIAVLREAMGDTAIWGSPPYMSPEQTRGTELDGRSDLFALGSVLYEAATGERLFKLAGRKATVNAIRRSGEYLAYKGVELALEERARGLGHLVAACLQPDPADRPESAHEVLEALEDIRAQLSGYGALRRSVRLALGERPRRRRSTSLLPNRGLPAVQSSFVGREDAIEEAGRWLVTDRSVTLTGPGGVGKTRLALELARRADGPAFWVDLSAARDGAGVRRAICEALGAQGVANDDRLADVLARRGRLLLVLDRCDRVTDEVATLAGLLLRRAQDAVLVATSREPLKAHGERVMKLGPLPAAGGVALLQARCETPLDRRVAERLVASLEGLPLSLELAAARLARTSPRELLRDVEDHQLTGLREGGRHGVTLERTILWSWATLEPWEQEALHQCSVFRGGFTFDHAERVLDLSPWPEAAWTLDVIGVLVEKSLVQVRTVDGAPRLELLAAIADFARDRLEDVAGTRRRHAITFAALGRGSALETLGSTGQDRALPALLREVDNLQAALDHALDARLFDEAVDLTAALLKAEELHGALAGVGAQIRQLLSEPALDDRRRLRLLLAAATAWRHREGQAYQQLVEQGEALARRLDDRQALAWIRWHQAAMAWAVGDHAATEARLAEAGAFARGFQDRHLELHVLRFEGFLARARGQLVKACDLHNTALQLAHELGDLRQEAAHTGALGRCLGAAGQIPEAVLRHQQALTIYRELGDRPGISAWCQNLAALHQQAGRLEEAEVLMREALGLERDLDRPAQVANLLHLLGNHSAAQGDIESALARLDRALDGYRDQGRTADMAALLADIGTHLLDDGQQERAARVLAQAREVARQADAPLALGAAARGLGDLALATRRTDDAMRSFAEATWAYSRLQHRGGEAAVRGRSALGEAQRGRLRVATAMLNDAVTTLHAVDDMRELVIALTSRGHVLHVRGEAQRARADWEQGTRLLGAMGLSQDTPLGRRLHALGALLETP